MSIFCKSLNLIFISEMFTMETENERETEGEKSDY